MKCQKPVDIQTHSVQINNNCHKYYAVDIQTLCMHFDYMFEYQKNHSDLLKKMAILKFKMEAVDVNCKPGTHFFLLISDVFRCL